MTVAAEPYDQFFINQFRQHVAERAYLAALNARVTLEAGFTTVRDVGCIPGSNFVDVSLPNAIAKRLVPGPRMLVAGNLIRATGGHCDFTGGLSFRATGTELDYTDGVADGPSALSKAVRFNVKHGADLIKFCASGGVLSWLMRSTPLNSRLRKWPRSSTRLTGFEKGSQCTATEIARLRKPSRLAWSQLSTVRFCRTTL